jgi:hypothetical protein
MLNMCEDEWTASTNGFAQTVDPLARSYFEAHAADARLATAIQAVLGERRYRVTKE